jgi:hypothetical protein
MLLQVQNQVQLKFLGWATVRCFKSPSLADSVVWKKNSPHFAMYLLYDVIKQNLTLKNLLPLKNNILIFNL